MAGASSAAVAGADPIELANSGRERLVGVDSLADELDGFVRARTPSLLRSAFLLTGDQHLAEDLVQNVLISTHRSWRRLHHAGNAEAYTRKVMYHLRVAWWRRGKDRTARAQVNSEIKSWSGPEVTAYKHPGSDDRPDLRLLVARERHVST